MAPIAVPWTRHMDRGVQVAITISLVIFTSVLVFVLHWRNTSPEERAALPRLIKRQVHRLRTAQPRLVRLVMWITIICSIVVPSVILWTRPLSPSVKIAVTVVALSPVVLALIIYRLHRFLQSPRSSPPTLTSDSETSSSFTQSS